MKAHWRIYAAVALIVVSVLTLGGAGLFVWKTDAFGMRHKATKDQPPTSRDMLLVAQAVVKDVKPAPTVAARAYAYTSTVYALVREQGTEAEALQASNNMLAQLFPAKKAFITEQMKKVADKHGLQLPTLTSQAKTVLTTYSNREKHDGFADLKWDGKIPTGEGKWVAEKPDQVPVTPVAGGWQRWLAAGSFTVPEPPLLRSAQDAEELTVVQQAVAKRDGAGVAQVNYWGGAPGTETPSGIWQNQLWMTVKSDLGYDASKRDATYAQLQMVLAQSLADSFMECWKAKYQYWTARPSMRIPGLDLAMDNPPFPGYPSGHATVSQTAADVLSALAPQHRLAWQQMAQDAANSRVIGGIHFVVDTKVGTQLGADVATQVIETHKLEAILQ